MLKGIPSLLSPELLKILMEMGHGDEIVIGDGNFPAASCAQRLVRCDGHGVPAVSYTHLDVYKRHVLTRLATNTCRCSCCAWYRLAKPSTF